MSMFRIIAAALIVATVTGCNKKEAHDPPARSVRTVTIERGADGETVSLTGQVRAKDQVSLAFRLDGRMIDRPVNVGDVLKPGQLVARLDPQNQQNALRSAQANLTSAEALLTQARLTYGRQQELLKDGWTPRAKFDEAQQAFLTAQAQVDSAQAQVRIAENQLSYTVLFADAAGRGHRGRRRAGRGGPWRADDRAGRPPGRTRRRLRRARATHSHRAARPGGAIALTNDPTVRATGRVREVAPQADPTTRTWQVKVGIIDPPPAFALGSTVTGSIKLSAPSGVEVPPSALTEANGRPAVWVVDPQSQTVALRNVDVSRYDPADVVISQGLETGDVVVTAGVQMLRPGQKVRLAGAAS